MSKILIHWIYGYHRDKTKNGYWTSSRVIWSEIIRVILKSDKREARVRFEVTIVISDQNRTRPSSVTTLLQPFWNRRIQSVPIFIWPCSRFVESGTRRLLHLFLYPKEKWCNIKAKMVRLKTKMTQFRTWTTRFRAKRWCDSWINHTAENQSDCKDRQWFQNGYNQSLSQSVSQSINQSINQDNRPKNISETGGQSNAHIPKPEACNPHI